MLQWNARFARLIVALTVFAAAFGGHLQALSRHFNW